MTFGDLATLGEVKVWLQTGQAAFPDTDDALLARLITSASQFIQKWLNRNIVSSDWHEVRDGTGGQRLTFGNFPVTAVLSLSIDGLAIPPARYNGGFGAGYVFSPTELALHGYIFPPRPQNVAITYTAGYSVIPADIAQACVDLVCLRYRERTRIGEVSRAIGSTETVTYSQRDMSEHLKLLLSQYRPAAPVSAFRQAAPTATDPALVAAAL